MKKQWFIIISLGLVISLLSGCNQLEELLDKTSQMFNNEQSEDAHTNSESNNPQEEIEESNNNETNTTEENEENESAPHVTADQELPFDERLITQGYELKPLPNGFPLEVPYHWVLVEDSLDNPGAEYFESTFCFDIPKSIEDIAHSFAGFQNVEHEHDGEDEDIIHTITFTPGLFIEDGVDKAEFFIDEHNNTCATTTFDFGEEDGTDFQSFYGEDPDTMVSEEELAMFEETNDNEEESNDEPVVNRERSVPDDYVEKLNRHQGNHNMEDMDFDADDIMSVRDRIREGDIDMFDFLSGYPKIFPYEWYLLKETDDPMNASWSGTFCTDTSMRQAIVKHHDMLTAHQSDIIDFNISESPQMNMKGDVEFTLNDEHGTGSWFGNTQFYIDRNDDFQTHKCVDVSMVFSPELLP